MLSTAQMMFRAIRRRASMGVRHSSRLTRPRRLFNCWVEQLFRPRLEQPRTPRAAIDGEPIGTPPTSGQHIAQRSCLRGERPASRPPRLHSAHRESCPRRPILSGGQRPIRLPRGDRGRALHLPPRPIARRRRAASTTAQSRRKTRRPPSPSWRASAVRQPVPSTSHPGSVSSARRCDRSRGRQTFDRRSSVPSTTSRSAWLRRGARAMRTRWAERSCQPT